MLVIYICTEHLERNNLPPKGSITFSDSVTVTCGFSTVSCVLHRNVGVIVGFGPFLKHFLKYSIASVA